MSMVTEDVGVPKPDSQADPLQDQECSEPSLSRQLSTTVSCCGSWTPSFTDCLMSPSIWSHGPCCDVESGHDHGTFILLDHLMESDSSETEKSARFCNDLLRELDPFLEKLRPARTQGDHRADEILNLLQSMGTKFAASTEGKSHQQQTQQSTLEHTASDRVRGDKSIFISRESRHKESFAKHHPCLDKLIRRISQTFDREFGNSKDENTNEAYPSSDNTSSKGSNIQLDFSMTSVQLALYPGDSKSGYRRHCDRQHSCRQEKREAGIESESETPGSARKKYAPSNNTKPERLITCIYYLTDDDWDASLDGGALRLFRPCDGDDDDKHTDSSTSANRENQLSPSYIDVVPYRDRMVVFRSDRIEHQVMPSHRRPRLAITMWFYGIVPKKSLAKASGIPSSAVSDVDTLDVMRKTITTTSKDSHPILPLPIHSVSSTKHDQSPSIFVSLASYRDSETRPTIDAMYSTALNPQRIFTGIVAQLMEGEKDDEDIWRSITGTNDELRPSNSKPWTPKPHQLRVLRLHARDATGPCYARGLCQSLYRGEGYVLQIDSHMRFRPNWDEYLIQTIQGLQDRRQRMSAREEIDHCEKIMLTAYPVGYTLPNNVPNETRGTYLVPWKFDAQGMLRQRGRLVARRKPSDPATDAQREHPGEELNSSAREPNTSYSSSVIHAHRQYLYAGGFNFAPARVVFDVPYDTLGLHHLFFGEELSMAVRLFTHGYDIYAPEETVCYHLWSRSHRPTNPSAMSTATGTTRNERKEKLKELSRAKVKKQLLGDEALIGVHCGLGTVRKAAAFAEHLGVDFERQEFVGEGWDCGELRSHDFVGNSNSKRDDGNESLFPADSVEAKVASLDAKAQSLIGMFLQGLQN